MDDILESLFRREIAINLIKQRFTIQVSSNFNEYLKFGHFQQSKLLYANSNWYHGAKASNL